MTIVHAHNLTATAIVALLDPNAPAKVRPVPREADFYEDGRAFWLSPDAVVSIEAERTDEVLSILLSAPRTESIEGGWRRLHPSHYGIEVESYFDFGMGGAAHDAHSAWELARKAVSR